MKTIILSAGYGTRLRPLTETVPKCLINIGSKPVLEYWLDKLEEIDEVDEVIINTHHLQEKVQAFIQEKSEEYHFLITEFYEEKLLGSAGTLWANRNKIKDNDTLVIYADNYSEISLMDFYQKFRSDKAKFHVAVFRSEKPKSCGIFNTNEKGEVVSFVEKPEFPESNLANAGIYAFNGNFYLSRVSGEEFDIGFSVLPKFVDSTSLHIINGLHIDIGTYHDLERINKILGVAT
ncbi:MAG TPA: nucleotidyltransferase family protein [Ignavibacteriales bacterium]|nr:nucleotidyltransferase family protein [Ignavibacteriales bacterium]